MAMHGALAENQRRNERVDRGTVTVPTSGVAYVTIDPRVNSSITAFLLNPYGELGSMRFMTAFQLTLVDGGTRFTGITAASPAMVSGNINSTSQTINLLVYAPFTVLTINVYAFTSSANPTFTTPGVTSTVAYQVWGALMNQGSTTITGGTF